jgi:hypothetical protein
MNRIPALITLVAVLALATITLVLYLSCVKYRSEGLVFTTDTALVTEAQCIRHRSSTDLFAVFGQGPGLLLYFPSDFAYAPAPYLRALEELR